MKKLFKPFVLLAVSFVALAALLAVLLKWNLGRPIGLALPLLICFCLAAIFSHRWQMRPVVTTLLSSGAYWLYFGGVSIALIFNSSIDWTPILETFAILGAAYAGSLLGLKAVTGKLNANTEDGRPD